MPRFRQVIIRIASDVVAVLRFRRSAMMRAAFAIPSSSCRADSEVNSRLRPWLLPHLSGASVVDGAVCSSLADQPTALDFISLLGDAAGSDMLETATNALAHALLRAAGFQTPLTAVR